MTRSHVLVIDPCLDVLERIGHMLGNQGFGVTCSSTILDAGCIARLSPDVIVVNADIEGAAAALGFLSTGLIRAGLGNTPIIHVTSSSESAESLAETDMIALVAPYSPDGLLQLIDAGLANRPRHQTPIDDQPPAPPVSSNFSQ